MRILNIEVGRPEERGGMEWVRVKVQAKAFARAMVRKMVMMAVMVVRCNVPRSVVANSFGFARVDVPECPGVFLVLDQVCLVKFFVSVLGLVVRRTYIVVFGSFSPITIRTTRTVRVVRVLRRLISKNIMLRFRRSVIPKSMTLSTDLNR